MSLSYKVRYEGSKEKNIATLHPDDTIDTLKRKILLHVTEDIPFDSIYLYAIKKVELIPEQLFKELSQNQKIELTYERLKAYLLNYEEPGILEKIARKDVYSIGDLYAMGLDKAHFVRIPIGQRFLGNKATPYPFVVDPLLIKTSEEVDEFLVENAPSMISTQNSLLVMNYGEIKDNTFHMVSGEELLNHFESLAIHPPVAIYMPFLFKKGITTATQFRSEREKLMDVNKQLLSKNTQSIFDSVDLFYQMYKNSKYPVLKSGISEIDMFIHQNLNMIIPLEQLFKILHATKEIPFIKYNPGFRRENLLRLFSDKQTFNGTKIPALSKAMIIKLIKGIGKNKTISMYLDSNMVCSIFENGSVRVQSELDELVSLEELEERIRILINPILENVKSYVEKSGFTYELFKNFSTENVETVSINYQCKVKLEKEKFSMKPYMSCISTVFNVTQDSISKDGGIKARYKRVANYNEMNAIDSFIRDVINHGVQREGVIEKIKDNFAMTQEQAEEKFIAFINEVEVEQGIYQNRKLRIKDNPGFATTFERERFTTNLMITMEDIESVRYLDVIPIYLSSLLEMVMKKQEELVGPICNKKAIEEERPIEEIVALPEQPFGENETPSITAAKELNFDDEGDDDMLDMLLGSDDEEDEEEDEGMTGGAVSRKKKGGDDDGESKMADITGMSLANPNYFSKRMEDRDPSLFIKKKTGKFNTYSRMCPSNIRRQPVILTTEEKERIDRTHPDSYSHAIKYGSDPEKPFYYICPRYWCIPENTSLSEEEVKAGACGGVDAIIPFDAKKVPKGKTIYEFGADPSDPSAHSYKEYYDEDGNYVQHHPGFIPGSKHPEGKCMPCCFKSWDAKEQVRRRQECSQEGDGKTKTAVPKRRKQTETQKDYIKGEEKFPLEPDRWGYMPVELQMFFGEDAKSVQVSTLDPVLKETAITLLRHGVETHPTQSFVACIADIFSDYSNEEIKSRMDKELNILRKKLKKVRKGDSDTKEKDAQEITRQIKDLQAKPTIKQMKQKIIDMLTVDNFTNYQNGNLVQEFYPGNTDGISIDEFQDSQLYKNLDTTEESQVEYFEKIIAAFKNFIAFLSNDEVVIDYQYLWDIISMPNEDLFPNGINLVIFEIPEDDITGNVEIVCPTNHYSSVLYNDKRVTLILVKKENFFEPIYLYDNMKKNISRFMFREQTLVGKPNIKVALANVREFLTTKCKPLPSLPKVYTFEQNVTMDKALKQLEKHMKKLIAIAVNYNGKAIGLHIESKNHGKGYIPVYPSNYKVTGDVPIVFGDDDTHWMNYERTVKFLTNIAKDAKLPCSPSCKVNEDGITVGVLTKTNQLVPIKTPEEMKDDEMGVCDAASYSKNLDKTVANSNKVDKQRVDFINALTSQKDHYHMFRNLARIELNRYKHQEDKTGIEEVIREMDRDSLESYTDSLFKVVHLFKKLLKGKVRFTTEKSDIDVENYVFPNTNLLTGKDNETGFFLRLADEALRYQRIKLFLFEKEKYLSFSDLLYKLNSDEILILESMITNEYFEGLKAFTRNEYVHFNTYDTAQPIITAPYSEKIIKEECLVKTAAITSGHLGQIFSRDFSLMNFGESTKSKRMPECSFELLMKILKDMEKPLERRDIQILLVEKYKEYPQEKILKKLYEEGKEQWVKMIRGDKITLEEFILSEHYYLTLLDIWMIATVFDIPIVFFGLYNNKVNNKKAFATRAPKTGNGGYYLIRTFAPKQNTIPKYGLIQGPSKELRIPLSSIPKSKNIFVAFELKDRRYVIPKINEYIEK